MNYIPVMPLVFLVLLLLPIKLSSHALKVLAFSLWVIGGLVLLVMGVARLSQAETDGPMLVIGAVLALIIGVAKGKFVLAKTSERNIARLDALTEPAKPIHVYNARSWIVIAVMVAIAVTLNTLPAVDLFWRGVVNLAVGSGLVMSSLNYLRALKVQPSH